MAGPALAAGVAAVGAAAAAAADAVAPQQGAAPQQEQQLPSFDSSRYTLHSQGAEAVSGWPNDRAAGLPASTAPYSCPLASSGGPLSPPPAPFLCRLQRVWEGSFLGRSAIVKQRFSKKYRHPQLDAKLTVSRLKGVRPGLAGGGNGRQRRGLAAGWLAGQQLLAARWHQHPAAARVSLDAYHPPALPRLPRRRCAA